MVKRLRQQIDKVVGHVIDQFDKISLSLWRENQESKKRKLKRIADLFLILPDKERKAFELKWFDNGEIRPKPRKNVEVAKIMGINNRAADMLIERALKKMRKSRT